MLEIGEDLQRGKMAQDHNTRYLTQGGCGNPGNSNTKSNGTELILSIHRHKVKYTHVWKYNRAQLSSLPGGVHAAVVL